jgi:CRISPR/Cas system CMR-associated protein Cmr5 small subunit
MVMLDRGLALRESKIEKIATGISELAGLSFLLGLTVTVCGCAYIMNILEKTFDKQGYIKRQKEKEKIVESYISALKQLCGETQKEREERRFYEYMERQGIKFT